MTTGTAAPSAPCNPLVVRNPDGGWLVWCKRCTWEQHEHQLLVAQMRQRQHREGTP